MTIAELNAVDIHRQNINVIKPTLAQLTELFFTADNKLTADLDLFTPTVSAICGRMSLYFRLEIPFISISRIREPYRLFITKAS
jgi:hypothetical protein